MKTTRSLAALIAFLALTTVVTPAFAQTTREEQLATARADKSQQLHPYAPDQLERRIEVVKSFLTTERPFYPFVGNVFRGTGIAVGAGYRGHFGDTGTFDVHGARALDHSSTVDGRVSLPRFGNERVRVELQGNWVDARRVPFYGVGNDAAQGDRSAFDYRATTVGLTARVQARPGLSVGAGVDAMATDTSSAVNPSYTRSRAFAEFDSRRAQSAMRRGGLYRLSAADYRDTGAGAFNFRRVDAEASQFLPIFRENWVIALRGQVSATSAGPGQEVPFFLLPDLGGSRGLRGYSSWRFRDRQSLLMTGEYRWTAGSFVDMALFVDAGKVAARFSDLDRHDLKTSYGIGVSLHTFAATIVRVDLARTRQGNSLVLSVNPSF